MVNYLTVRFLSCRQAQKAGRRIVEGKADLLIEGGKLRPEHLKKN